MKKLLEEKKDRETLISLAQIYDKTKKYTELAATLTEAEALSKDNDEKETVYFLRGAMYEKMKKFDQAEAEFRKVIELNPDNASALNYLGYMLADRNVRVQEAVQMINKALEKDPGNGAYLDSLGWAYYRLGRYAEAESNLKLALEKVSRDPTVHDHLGDVYMKQGKLKDAITQWEASVKEWESTSAAEQDPVELAKVHKKIEGARVRLAKENSGNKPQQ
jgi:Flp pilus assembly protein TadD